MNSKFDHLQNLVCAIVRQGPYILFVLKASYL